MNSILKVVKDTLENEKNITILSMYEEIYDEFNKEIVVIFINDVRDTISFLNNFENHINITLEGYNVVLLELGYLLKSVYNNPKLFLFVKKIRRENDYIIKNDLYNDIIEAVYDNLPLFIVKSYIINQINYFSDNIDINIKVNQDFILLINTIQFLIDTKIVECDINFLKNYNKKPLNEETLISIQNDLNTFKNIIEYDLECEKITESFIRKLDLLYINLQILCMKL